MNAFMYQNPVKIKYGVSYQDEILEIIKSFKRRSVLILTSAGVYERNLKVMQKSFDDWGVEVISNIYSNPELEFLQKLSEGKGKYSAIIAIGGGSVIDSAKFLSVDGQITADKGSLYIADSSSFLPIFAFPTTAGTSSELTQWATVWDSKTLTKYSLNHYGLYPKVGYYDWSLTATLSRKETINGALDSLSHALESIWNKNKNPISTVHALRSIEMIVENLPLIVEDLKSLKLRKIMMLASIYAGLAFSNTQTALAHSISYPITMCCGVPHGLACSFTIPLILENLDDRDCIELLSPYKNKISKLFKDLGVSTSARDYGLDQAMIEEIFSNLNARSKNALINTEKIKQALIVNLNSAGCR